MLEVGRRQTLTRSWGPLLGLGAWLSLVSTSGIAGAQPAPPPLPANVQVVASGLNNPRGFTWGPDGALYVAEAGSPPAGYRPAAGPPDPNAAPVVNDNGLISRIESDGTRTTITDGLPVVVGPLGDTVGVASVAFIGSKLYAIISAGPAHGHPDFAGGVYRVNADGSLDLIADTDAYNVAHPPASCAHCGSSEDELSNPYDMVALSGKLYISDGNKDVIHVVDPAVAEARRITRLDLSPGGHKVLTGLAVGPDGNLFVANLTPAPFRTGAASVRRVTRDGRASEVAGGLSAASGLAVAPDGTMYVAEFATTLAEPPFLAPPGRIVAVGADGLAAVAEPMMFPSILRWAPDGLYGTNFSVGGNGGEGAIVRIGL